MSSLIWKTTTIRKQRFLGAKKDPNLCGDGDSDVWLLDPCYWLKYNENMHCFAWAY